MRLPLPNHLWIRSNLQPEWAICLDPDDARYGCKCRENINSVQSYWEGRSPLRLDEIDWALKEEYLRPQWEMFQKLRDHVVLDDLADEAGIWP